MSKETKDISKELLYLNILKSIPEAIIVCNEKYEIIFVNESLIKVHGANESDIVGQSLQNIIHNTSKIDCHICKGNPTKYIPEENYFHQATLTDSTGKEVLVRISHSLINGGGYYISLISPMSNLVCLDQAQIDFVSTVSHELRTPMTSIKGFADTLLNAGDQLSKEQQIRFISIIKAQADRLTRLVENLLTVSRLETKRHKSVFRSLNLKTYVERIVMGLKNKYQKHNFKIDINDKVPPIWADQDKLEQILTNLIDNAAKYSEEGKTVTINAQVLPDDPDQIVVNIIDEGVGIPEKYLSKIFNKFSRIDNPLTRQVQGTGLGLYITKALIESMNGTISLHSNDKGTTFTFVLHVATPERQAKQGLAEY